MSEENIEVVGKIIRGWNSGGLDAILPFWPEDVVWYPFPEWPDGAEARIGHDGVRELMDTWTDNFDGRERPERPLSIPRRSGPRTRGVWGTDQGLWRADSAALRLGVLRLSKRTDR
jgi:hypothetical protein